MSNENGKLLCQIGKMVVSASLEKGGKIKSSSQGVKPYGFISVDKAWAMKVEKSSFSGFGTKTTTTTRSDPRRILRPEYLGTHFVVFADKAIIRVNKDGKVAWTHKWKYHPDQRNLLFDPVFVGANDDVIYACKGFYGIDGKSGEVLWEDKDVEGEFTQVADDLLVVRKKDKVKGFSLK